jgi:predicted nucleic acid-binding protein
MDRPDDQIVFSIARLHRLTFYDAAYLELALHENAPLATLDGSLAKAAAADGVPLLIAS